MEGVEKRVAAKKTAIQCGLRNEVSEGLQTPWNSGRKCQHGKYTLVNKAGGFAELPGDFSAMIKDGHL